MVFQRFKKQVLQETDFQDPKDVQRVVNSLQNNIADSVNPIISKVQVDSSILTNVTLSVGQNNIINTKLNRTLTGWQIVRKRNQADIWDTQDSNPSPNLTLWLSTSADVVVDILVF